jgi:hypothetical protein
VRTRRACADSLNRDGRVPEALRIEYEIKNYVGSPGVIGVLPARPVVQLDAASDNQPCREALAARGMVGEIATRGVPAPIQASRRWPVERTHAWGTSTASCAGAPNAATASP